MTATAIELRDSAENLRQAVRDLESKASELQEEMQKEPSLYRAEETRVLEIRKRALEEEIIGLEARTPRFGKGKHKLRIEDLRIDMRAPLSRLAEIASDRANYMNSLSTQLEETTRELELARRELAALETEAFYRETMRPALIDLVEARAADDRLRFLDRYKEAAALLGQMKREGVDGEEQQKCWVLYDYVLGLACMEWFPGDPGPLMADLRDRTRAWNGSADSEDAMFELAVANGLLLMPLQVMRKLEQSSKAGDVPHRMRQIEETCPGALETSERKCIHAMRIADQDWLRQLAGKGLDRLNQIRRSILDPLTPRGRSSATALPLG